MSSSVLFRLLETCGSEIAHKTLFKTRYTKYMPDFFFIFVYISIFLLSALIDRIMILEIFEKEVDFTPKYLFLFSCFGPLIYALLFEKDECFPEVEFNVFCRFFVKVIFIFFGMDSIIRGGQALSEAFKGEEDYTSEFPSFFHIPNQNLSFIKIYCCVLSVTKSIPQLFIAPVLILANDDKSLTLLVQTNIFINMIVFSLTMAVTLPIRKSPRIFKSSICVVLNAVCKFMATMCACGLILSIFAFTFSRIGYYAFLINVIRIIWSIWPTCIALTSQSLSIPYLFLCGFFFSLIFSFIYIHPFEGKGKLFYYYFYLLSFMTEIAFIYILTEGDYDFVIIYYAMRVLIIGFVSCFGLVNILQNVKSESERKKKIASEHSMLKQPSEYSSQNEIPTQSS